MFGQKIKPKYDRQIESNTERSLIKARNSVRFWRNKTRTYDFLLHFVSWAKKVFCIFADLLDLLHAAVSHSHETDESICLEEPLIRGTASGISTCDISDKTQTQYSPLSCHAIHYYNVYCHRLAYSHTRFAWMKLFIVIFVCLFGERSPSKRKQRQKTRQRWKSFNLYVDCGSWKKRKQ